MADFLTVFGNSGYNIGSTPSTPVAEQNQTYFAYFNSIGGTGPEYIDGTGYFIKYLIDINGNVVNPEPYTETTSIEAVPLHNLKANFEVGKNAIVKTVEPNPTQDTSPNANVLAGSHRIAHIGKIVPILVTETGENKQDYVTTMSFGPTSTQTSTTSTFPNVTPVANVTAQFQYDGGEYGLVGYNDLYPIFNYPLVDSPAWQYVASNARRILSSSFQTGTRIRMKVDFYLEETWNANNGYNIVRLSLDRIGASSTIGILTLEPLNKNGDTTIGDGEGGVYTTGWTDYFDYMANDLFYMYIDLYDGSNNREVKVKGVADDRSQTVWYIEQETPPSVTATSTEVLLTTSVNMATSSYFISASNFPDINGGYSVLTVSPGLTRMYNLNQTQNLPTASATMNFSPINIPFSDIKPGDFIRFEYRKNQNYTIFNINQINFNGESALQLSIIPSLSNISGSSGVTNDLYLNLDHFVIYRVINDGLYVTLDVAKDAPGGAYTGLLLPEFVSQELSEKLETLIRDLTDKEIIQ